MNLAAWLVQLWIKDLEHQQAHGADSEKRARAANALAGLGWMLIALRKLHTGASPILAALFYPFMRPPSPVSPAPGYERWYREHGVDPLRARSIAYCLVQEGKSAACISTTRTAVVRAIRLLAKPGVKSSRRIEAAGFLLEEWQSGTTVETLYQEAGGEHVVGFMSALWAYHRGYPGAEQRMVTMAAAIAPRLVSQRGPKIRPESAAHEAFLQSLPAKESPGYTWDPDEELCNDDKTEATRGEFALARFDPRPAYRRLAMRQSETLVAPKTWQRRLTGPTEIVPWIFIALGTIVAVWATKQEIRSWAQLRLPASDPAHGPSLR